MNKKVIGIIICLLVICAIGVVAFFILNNKSLSEENNKQNNNTNEIIENNKENEEKENKETEENNKAEESEEESTTSNGKTLVVYYSATNNTKSAAESIAKNLNADIFEIVPAEVYTDEDLNYGNPNSRVSKEHDDESLRNVKLKTTKVENWDKYDTILIGYPIWWGIAAWPVDTFVTANDFTGKTVIPFCTSVSSGLGESGKLLAAEAKGGNWLEGHRFGSHPSASDIKSFIDSIK